MADKVLIEIVSKAEGLDETNEKLQQLAQREKELLSQMDSLTKQKAQWQGIASVVSEFDKDIEGVNAELKSTRKSMEDLSKSAKAMPAEAEAKKATQSFRAMRKEIEEQIRMMQLAGEEGTEAYHRLVEEAGRLNDIQGDVAQEIRNMASDTGAFDAILSGTQLVAGGFSVAQGAMALFGSESEDMQKMMVNLQSAIAITTGLQQIQTVVQKESAMMMGIHRVATVADTIAMKILGTTTAATSLSFKLLRGAIISTGIGALVVLVGELINHWEDLVGWFKKGTDGMSGFGKAIDKVQEMAMGVYEVIKTYILTPFRTIGKIITGDFKGAFAEIKKGFNVVGNYQKGANEQMVKNTRDMIQAQINEVNKGKSENMLAEAENLQKALEVDKARGLSAEELYNREMAILKMKIKGYNLALSAIGDKNSDKAKEIMKILDDLAQQQAIKTATNDNRINQQAEDNRKQAADSARQSAEKAKQEKEKRDAEILKAQQDLEDELVKAMEDGANKEIATLQNTLKRRLDEIKGNSPAEIALRAQLIANAEKEEEKIRKDAEEKYKQDRYKSRLEAEVAITNAQLAEVEKGSDTELELRKKLLDQKATLDIAGVKASTESEEWKAAKILEINANLNNDLKDLSVEYIKTAQERSEGEVLEVTQQYEQGKISRYTYEKQLRDISIQSLQDEIEERKTAGESTVELEKELSEKRIEIAEEEAEYRKQLFEELFNAMGEIGNIFFDMQKQKLDQQLSDLQHYYTTDAEEAKKNKDMKLISEDEMSRKQLEIKRKQAQAEKEQARFNVLMSTAQSIAASAKMGFPLAIPFIAMAIALGAVQIAAINSKPLPKYWKGRKGGKGEFALMGEYGPEIAWLPAGASLMPANDSRRALMGDGKAFDRWNMPRMEPKFTAPSFNHKLATQVLQNQSREDRLLLNIDYDKLGRAVAKHAKYPKQKDVIVSFDKSGLSITEGNTTTHFLNSKYNS